MKQQNTQFQNTLPADKIFLSVQEAARISCISAPMLYKLWAKGEGPDRIKVGSRTLIPVFAWKAWMQTLSQGGQL